MERYKKYRYSKLKLDKDYSIRNGVILKSYNVILQLVNDHQGLIHPCLYLSSYTIPLVLGAREVYKDRKYL
jgi:hypothetical protein